MAERRPPTDMSALLGALGALLWCLQYVTLVKFNVLPPALSYGTLPRFWQAVQQKVALGPVDALLAAAVVALCAAVVVLECRHRRLSLFLNYIFASERRTLLFLTTCSLVFARFFFASGSLSWGADAAGHITYTHITGEALGRGEWPSWTNYLGLGSPYLQFYGFLFYYLAGAVQVLCGDVHIAVKLVLGMSHALSGVGLYLWVRRATGSRRAAFVGGVAYVLSFWHVQQVILMGRLPLGLFYALLPWPFYFFERLRRGGAPAVVGAAATLGALALTHPGYGFWAMVFWGLYATARLAGAWGSPHWIGALKKSLVAAPGSVGLSAYLTLGMLLERGATGLHGGIELTGIADPTWLQVFGWSNFRFWLVPTGVDHWYGGYVGLSLALLALAALAVFARRRRSWHWEPLGPAWAALALALALVFGYRWSALQALPMVTAFNAGRYLVFVVLFLAFTAGAGTRILLAGQRPRQDRVVALLLIAVMVDLGTTTFQHPYTAPGTLPMAVDPEIYDIPRQTAAPYHQRGELPGYRISWLRDEFAPFLAMAQMIYQTGTPVCSAPSAHNLRAVSTLFLPVKKWADQLAVGLEDDPPVDAARRWAFVEDGMGLFNIRYLLLGTEQGARLVEQLHHTPVLAAPTAVPLPTGQIDAFLRERGVDGTEADHYRAYWLVRAMEVDLPAKRCARIFLIDDVEPPASIDPDAEVELLEHRVWHERVELRLRVSGPSFVRLAYAHYPHLRVSVDGTAVEPLQTAGRFIALHLDSGEHVIRIEARLSPLRQGLLALAVALTLLGALALWRARD